MQRFRRVDVHVDADQVDQRAGPDRPVGAEAHRPVDVLGADPGLVEDAHAVIQERDQDPVDDEAGRVVAGDRFLAEAPREGVGGLEGLVARIRRADHLDERQHRRRVEEVHADHSLGCPRRLGDLRHRERGGVRGEDGVGRDEPVELLEELALDLQILEGSLDHEPAGAELGDVGDERQAAERRVLLVLAQAPFLDAAGQVVVDRLPPPLAELRVDLAADHLDSGLDADLRDAGAHGAEPDDADARDLRHGARS